MHRSFCTLALLSIAQVLPLAAQLVADDRTYSPTIRTVQLYKEGFELSAPVIELGSSEALVLRFDDLQPYTENLSYTLSLIHI